MKTIIPKEIYTIQIVNQEIKPTLFNRFKTKVWNFILPPHIRLGINLKDKQ